MKPLKDNHRQALQWLREHGGSAVRVHKFDEGGRIIGKRKSVRSRGSAAPFSWFVFERLLQHGLIRERAGFRIQVVEQA